MEKDLFDVLQSEVEIAKCLKYRSELIEQTIDQLASDGTSNYADLIARVRKLDYSSLYFFDLSLDQFEYFRTAVIRVLEARQLGQFSIDSDH